MGRLLGLDYGEKRIGIAASDPLQIIASPREVLHRTTIEADIDHIARIVEEDEVEAFVVGCPFNTDGTRNKMVDRVEAFVAELTVRSPFTGWTKPTPLRRPKSFYVWSPTTGASASQRSIWSRPRSSFETTSSARKTATDPIEPYRPSVGRMGG